MYGERLIRRLVSRWALKREAPEIPKEDTQFDSLDPRQYQMLNFISQPLALEELVEDIKWALDHEAPEPMTLASIAWLDLKN